MSRRETQKLYGTIAAAGVVLLAAGGLLWRYFGSSVPQTTGGAPGGTTPPDGTDASCPAGYMLDTATGQCVPHDGGTPVVPSLLPDVNAMKGPMLPPRGKVLIVGGELAVGLAKALTRELVRAETTQGFPVTPSAISVWDGADVLYSFELLSAGLAENGVPKPPACAACPPDLVIFMTGEVNMHWGPVDANTQKAISHLTDAFAVYARDHYPNMLWVSPPTNPDFDDPPFESQLKTMLFLSAQAVRPGRSAFLNLRKFERAYPGAPITGVIGAPPMMVDHAVPNEAGYAAIAQQVTALLTDWYLKHPWQAAS